MGRRTEKSPEQTASCSGLHEAFCNWTHITLSFPQSSGWRWSGLPSEVDVVLAISPKAMCLCVYVCDLCVEAQNEVSGVGVEWSSQWSPHLSPFSERSSLLVGGETVKTAAGLVLWFRLRADATSRHDSEQLARRQSDRFCVRVWLCVQEFFFPPLMSDSAGVPNLTTPPSPDLRSLVRRAGGGTKLRTATP